MTLALYDARKSVKISEDFHIDLNSDDIKQMLPSSSDDNEVNIANTARQVYKKFTILILIPYL